MLAIVIYAQRDTIAVGATPQLRQDCAKQDVTAKRDPTTNVKNHALLATIALQEQMNQSNVLLALISHKIDKSFAFHAHRVFIARP